VLGDCADLWVPRVEPDASGRFGSAPDNGVGALWEPEALADAFGNSGGSGNGPAFWVPRALPDAFDGLCTGFPAAGAGVGGLSTFLHCVSIASRGVFTAVAVAAVGAAGGGGEGDAVRRETCEGRSGVLLDMGSIGVALREVSLLGTCSSASLPCELVTVCCEGGDCGEPNAGSKRWGAAVWYEAGCCGSVEPQAWCIGVACMRKDRRS